MILPKLINSDILVNILPSAGGYISRGEMACAKTDFCTLEEYRGLYFQRAFEWYLKYDKNFSPREVRLGNYSLEKNRTKETQVSQPMPMQAAAVSKHLDPSSTVCLSSLRSRGKLRIPRTSFSFFFSACPLSIHSLSGESWHKVKQWQMGSKLLSFRGIVVTMKELNRSTPIREWR